MANLNIRKGSNHWKKTWHNNAQAHISHARLTFTKCLNQNYHGNKSLINLAYYIILFLGVLNTLMPLHVIQHFPTYNIEQTHDKNCGIIVHTIFLEKVKHLK